jgi:[acyl-carrier-protein] S-malonyltransferase
LNPFGHGIRGHSTGVASTWQPVAMSSIGSSYAVVFPGQGSQSPGMADPWVSHPSASRVLDEASEALGHDVIEGCRDEALLATTEFVQPALLACEVAAFRVLDDMGISLVGAAGHSLGEFAAIVASGACELAPILEVVVVRGRAMQEAGDERPGTMSALLGPDMSGVAELCERARGDDVLVVANENSPSQVVISGSFAAVERAEALAAGLKLRAVRLNVAGAFHSPLMEPAVAPIVESLKTIEFRPPRFPIAENVTGTLVEDPEELRASLGSQVISPVKWESCARALAAAGASTFLEAGPGDVLTKMAKRVVPGTAAIAVGSPEAAAALVELHA